MVIVQLAKRDVEQVFDKLPAMTVAHYLVSRGVPRALVATVARLQMPCTMLLLAGDTQLPICAHLGGYHGNQLVEVLALVPVW